MTKNKQENNKDIIRGHRLSDEESLYRMMQESESCFNIDDFNEIIEVIKMPDYNYNYNLLVLSSENDAKELKT